VTWINQVRAFETTKSPRHKDKSKLCCPLLNSGFYAFLRVSVVKRTQTKLMFDDGLNQSTQFELLKPQRHQNTKIKAAVLSAFE